MPRFVHFTLADGRSIVASYDESAERYLGHSGNLVFVADDREEFVPLSAVRECRVYEPRQPLPPQTRVYNFAFAA
jgi:hypothetical protein